MEDSRVLCGCYDIDNHDGENKEVELQKQKLCAALEDFGLPYLIERSQSGTGYHVWLHLERAAPAKSLRRIMQGVLHYAHLSLEVYPKQDELSKETKLGNLVRYPLGGQSCFLKPSGEVWEPLEAMAAIQPIAEGLLQKTLDRVEIYYPAEGLEDTRGYTTEGLPPRVHQLLEAGPSSLLYRRWHCDAAGMRDGSMSAIVQSIAGQLVRGMIPTPEIEAAVRWWCKTHGYAKGEREGWVERTVASAYANMNRTGNRKEVSGHMIEGIALQYADILMRNEEHVLTTGIAALDDSIRGLAYSELTVIAARPSQGKSALLLQMLEHMSEEGLPTLMLSREMSGKEYARRLFLRLTDVPEDEWNTSHGNLRLKGSIATHFRNRAPQYFLDVDPHIDRVDEAIDWFVKEYGVKAAGLDYQGLCSWRGNEYEDQTEITKRLKQAAKRNDIAMISLVQLKRPTESNAKWEPALNQLRSSGEIENSADVVVAGKWPFIERIKSYTEKDYFLYALKNRNRGIKIPKMKVSFDCGTQRFV